jgi:hypothetical protein
MALKPLNSVAGFSVGETPANIILANGDITTTNITTTGISNLNAISNVIITGGINGQVIQTDGAGNLSFTTISTASLANGNSNIQVLANGNITFSSAGTANVAVITSTGVNVAGYISGGNVIANGNVSVNNYIVTPSSVDLIVAPDTQITRFYSNVNPFSGGYSLGNSLARWDNVFANTANIDGNVSAGNVLTNNLLYANGQPWDLQEAAGSNTQIQYNDGNNNFGASANFTFDYSTNVLTVNGNANITGAVNTANINSGANTFVINANGYTTTFNANGLVEFDDGIFTTGNSTVGNANLGNLATANYINVSNEINGNVANFTGNITGLNANLGNLAQANYVNVSQQINGNVANFSGNLTSQNANLGNLVTANFVNVSSNLQVTDTANVGNLRTDNLLYANGQPWDLQEAAGSNTQIQYNDGSNDFGASANFTYDDSTQVLTVAGNANITNTLLTPNVNSGSGNLTLTSNGKSTVYDTSGNVTFPVGGTVTAGTFVGNVEANITITAANTTILFSDDGLIDGTTGFTFDKTSNAVTANGNLTVNNADLGNLATANYINVSSNVTASNVTVNLQLSGNTANFTGNVTAGNLITSGSGGDITMSGGNITGANVVSANTFSGNLSASTANISGNLVTSNLTVNLELAGNTANFTGNVTLSGPNVTVNNHLSGNTANFSGNITSLNANLGNIADANYIRTQQLYNGSANIDIINNGNIAFSPSLANVMVISNAGANIVGYVTANGNGTFGAVYSNTVTAQGGNLTLSSEQAGNTYIQLRPHGNGTVDVGNVRITSLAMPNAASDAATKQYVDDVAQGLHVHASCGAATPDTLANISGGTVTYNNGTAGVGATLTTTGTYTLIDGVNVASSGFRILVKDEANTAHNGIYTYSNSTVLTRATDFDTAIEIAGGDFTFVTGGTTYNSTGWVQIDEVTVVGTDPIVWDQFSGAGEYTAGQGLTLTGTVFSVNVDNITTEISGGNVIVKANAQFTTPNIGAATGTSVDLTGNVLAGNVNSNAKVTAVDFEASGNIIAANISANANLVVNNATVNLELSGNTANFSGNVVVPNLQVNTTLSGNVANFTGNLTASNANLGNLVTANYVNVATNLTTLDANVTGTLTVANANIGGNLTVSNLAVNLELAGNTANFSGNVVVPNLTVNLELAGNTANFIGNITALNANLGNLVTANYANFTNDLVVQGNIANANNITVTNDVTANGANIIGNIVTNNLTVNLDISGNTANFTGNIYSPSLIANTEVVIGSNSIITYGNTTTTSVSANQTIASFSITGVTGVEYLVKAVDSTGSKYSVATVLAVTDGTSADYIIYGSSQLGGYTGSLAVNVSGSFIRLQVTPASSNSTVWTTQYRLI